MPEIDGGIHSDGTVVLMEPNTQVCRYLTVHFLAVLCLRGSPEAKSVPYLFLTCCSIAQAGFWYTHGTSLCRTLWDSSGKGPIVPWVRDLELPIRPVWMHETGSWAAFGGRPAPVSAVVRPPMFQKLETCWRTHQDESLGTVITNSHSTKCSKVRFFRLSIFAHTSALSTLISKSFPKHPSIFGFPADNVVLCSLQLRFLLRRTWSRYYYTRAWFCLYSGSFSLQNISFHRNNSRAWKPNAVYWKSERGGWRTLPMYSHQLKRVCGECSICHCTR